MTDIEHLNYLARRKKEEDDERTALSGMINVLRSLGIKMEVAGCGCCGSPIVKFQYKDINVDMNDASFNTED